MTNQQTYADLAKYFVEHSPRFFDDLEAQKVDDKHSHIVHEAYREITHQPTTHWKSFRNWAQHSDIAVPVQFTLADLYRQGFPELIRKLYIKVFRREENKRHLSWILDDLSIIKLIGGDDLLKDNPVHLTPGASLKFHINGTSVNPRWIRYIYLLMRIIDRKLLEGDSVWVDVGSYYGGLQGLIKKYRPDARLILVDFHHQLCRSYIYLSKLFPDTEHILPDQLFEHVDCGSIPKGAIMYVPPCNYSWLANQQVDLVTNFVSLGEMPRETFTSYLDSRLFRESVAVFYVNRFVGAPFFEKTYNNNTSILDYLKGNRHIDYFDMFPIHHYVNTKRNLFGRKAFRNVSSPYFEMVTSNTKVA